MKNKFKLNSLRVDSFVTDLGKDGIKTDEKLKAGSWWKNFTEGCFDNTTPMGCSYMECDQR